ncbi:MAG: hypothetical protein J6X69_05875 [Bacteroidales bacterium]|nr:hypothetical protein [Bacteroidales bacterium]
MMKPRTFITRCMGVCLSLFCLLPSLAFGEPGAGPSRAIHLQGGFQDIGITYSFTTEQNNNFHSISLLIDTQDLVTERMSTPGGFVRYDYHFALLNQDRMLLYAGPGAMAGYVTDHRQPYGLTLGLAGNFGFKYLFDKSLTLGVSIHPVLGYHIHRTDGQAKLNFYQSGLWRTILPEFSIGYNFGNQEIVSNGGTEFRPAGQARRRRWTLGLEAAYRPAVYNYHLSMYLADDGSRYCSNENCGVWRNNASLMLSAAWHFTEYYQLRLLLGFAGIRPNVRVHELLLRNQWNFKPINDQGDRLFAAVDAGCAMNADDLSKPYALLNVSFGYSLAISADSNIEFFIRSVNCYGTPTMYEDGLPVPAERAYKSQFFQSGVALGIALDL